MNVFDLYYKEYEEWFEKYDEIYEQEINTIKMLLPDGRGMEVGIGSGRFAKPLGINFGIDPSEKMIEIAKKRGIRVLKIKAENMNFKKEFDFILMVTTICFVNDPFKTVLNSYKALKKGGYLLIAFIDLDSPLGKVYEKNKNYSEFYKVANFFTKKDIIELMTKAGFKNFKCKENLYGNDLNNLSFKIGNCNGGAFKVIRGQK